MGAVVAETSEFPLFELYGPPCRAEDCSGVLVPHVTLSILAVGMRSNSEPHTEHFWKHSEVAPGFTDFERTVERLLKGGKGPPDAS